MLLTELHGNKNKTVTYSLGLSKLTGSMVSAAMFQFIVQNWERTKKPLSWFARPCDHPEYSTGRSWEENLGLSVDDIKYGLGFIGTRITTRQSREDVLKVVRPDFDIKGKMVNANKLVLYYKKQGKTYYELNVPLAAKAIELQVSGDWKNYIAPLSNAMKEIRDENKTRPEIDYSTISSFREMIIPELPEGLMIEDGEQ
jgi:hypothetical protein